MNEGPSWTLEQAAELVLEHMLELLDGADDDDVVRPAIALEMIREVWAPQVEIEPLEEGTSAGTVRARIAAARLQLARGGRIP